LSVVWKRDRERKKKRNDAFVARLEEIRAMADDTVDCLIRFCFREIGSGAYPHTLRAPPGVVLVSTSLLSRWDPIPGLAPYQAMVSNRGRGFALAVALYAEI
jgi:hypothetical protein